MKNFPFEYNGETYWYSRSIATNCLIFAKDKLNELYILVVKRGKNVYAAPDMYCIPGGFLDFDEDLKTCVCREVYEETGLQLNRYIINLLDINSIPNISDRQTVIITYYTILPGFISDYELNSDNSEPDEIQEIMFMPISMLLTTDINFAFNNRQIILDAYNKLFVKSNNNSN